MKQFIITTEGYPNIRFSLYEDAASMTVAAFTNALPLSIMFFHARVSGQEIWTDKGPGLDIPQENASVFTEPGEIAIGPLQPARNKIVDCIGIFYGEGKLLDCGNIFGKVLEEDLPLLQQLGDEIWKQGAKQIHFKKINNAYTEF